MDKYQDNTDYFLMYGEMRASEERENKMKAQLRAMPLETVFQFANDESHPYKDLAILEFKARLRGIEWLESEEYVESTADRLMKLVSELNVGVEQIATMHYSMGGDQQKAVYKIKRIS